MPSARAASSENRTKRMLDAGVELLPVVDRGEVVGVCTPNDIVKARAHRLDHERVQPGWLTRALSGGRPDGPAAPG